jgi:hypothetical protein
LRERAARVGVAHHRQVAGRLRIASLPHAALAPALVALGIESDTGLGYDFSGLDIGHIGHIYEGLLSLRLSLPGGVRRRASWNANGLASRC